MALRGLKIPRVKLPPDVARAAVKLVGWAKANGYRVMVIKEEK